MRRVLIGVAAAMLGSAALAQSAPSAEQVVAARQAAFLMSAGNMAAMGAAVQSNATSVRPYAINARSLVRWARALPGLFPAGTGLDALPGRTGARPEIWSNRAAFEAAAANYATAAEALATAAQADDAAAFRTQFGAVRQACGTCHQQFRREEERPARPG